MKYTRYDLKANKKKNDWKTMPILIILVCILAIAIGTLIFRVIYPKFVSNEGISGIINKSDSNNLGNNNESNNKVDNTVPVVKKENNDNKVISKEVEEFLTVQFGYYSSKENADKVKNEIGNKAVVVKDGEKYRVIGYIGQEEGVNKYINGIKDSELESSKARFAIPTVELCDKEIIEIVNGLVDIIDKVRDEEVKSIKTSEFKEWSKGLEVCKECKDYELLSSLKTQVEKLPEAVSKSDVESSYQIIFDLLNGFK